MSTTQPTDEWRRLGDTAPQRFKSRQAGRLERDIAEVLKRHAPPDVEGCWVDIKGREPVWIAAGSESAKR